jgi:hypothetical protein
MSATLAQRFDGRACVDCGARRDLLVVWRWRPGNKHYATAHLSTLARCLDREACRDRCGKRAERTRVRASCLILQEPAVPDAPMGTCKWCGEKLTGENGSRRNYCYPDREGRDCRREYDRSRTWDPRVAVRRTHGTTCAGCGVQCEPVPENQVTWEGEVVWVPWSADHRLPLEDGGSHTLDNLQCLCDPCHAEKTAREARERAARRRAICEAQAMVDAGQVSLLEATFIADALRGR